MENLDIILEGINPLLLWVEWTFIIQPAVYQPKLFHLRLLVSKVSSAVLNIWSVTLVNPSFLILILMMEQMSSE